jgi:hypothetical protein
MFRLRDDRPGGCCGPMPAQTPVAQEWPVGVAAALARSAGWASTSATPALAFKLLLPGFLIAIGAGQVIPFLNLYIQGRFQLELSEVNAVFAVTAFGTMVAILLQPALARRYGKIGSVVIVQTASIPFLVVLGFAPLVWLVIIAMAVRNSLMNAGNPSSTPSSWSRSAAERATIAAAMSLLWSLGWVIAGLYYSFVQATLGFDAGLHRQLRDDHRPLQRGHRPVLALVPRFGGCPMM